MVRSGLAIAAATLLSGTALAADPPRLPLYPPQLPPLSPFAGPPTVMPWDGFYSGFGIGYMWTNASVRQPSAAGDYDLDGTTGFSFIGRNWQFGQFVAGLQGEIGVHETKGSLAIGPTTGAQGDQLWSAGFKGRLGYAFGSFLPFVSAGVATTEFHEHSALLFTDGDVRLHGGFTLGAGVDIAWTQRFVTRFEYEYADYGRRNYVHDGVSHRVDLESHTVKASVVFREVPGSAGGGMLSPGRSGSYAGVLGSYSFADATLKRPVGTSTNVELEGFSGGLFSGYDLSFGNWFVGYDGQLLISSIDGRGAGTAGPIYLDQLWSSAYRARVGTTYGAFSPYVAAGFALAQMESVSLATASLDLSMAYGGTAGIGVDFALNDRWFTRAEYAYTHYFDAHSRVDGVKNNLDLDRHDFRVGLGYRLSD